MLASAVSFSSMSSLISPSTFLTTPTPSILSSTISVASSSGLVPTLMSSSVSALAFPMSPVTVQTVGNYVFNGCWTEGIGVRALTPGAFAADTMTVETCASNCAGYTYFGVEYGRECMGKAVIFRNSRMLIFLRLLW